MLNFFLPKSRKGLLLTALSSRLICFPQAFCNRPRIKLKIQPAPSVSPCSYMAKNKILLRPLSPHLSIYKAQMSSMMSISLRITGLSLGAMAWAVCLTKLVTDLNVEDIINFLARLEIDDCYWTAAKTAVAFPFAFHFVAGLRHLMFDTAKLLERTQFFATGCAAIVLALSLTLVLGSIEDIRAKYEEMWNQKRLEMKKE